MNYLGIDYGNKRIGLAKGSSELKVATPLRTIENNKEVFDKIKEIIESEEVQEIIMGVPISLDGKEYGFAKKVRGFGKQIENQLGISVSFVDEALTTDEAAQSGAKDLDASSAAIILQDFLDSN